MELDKLPKMSAIVMDNEQIQMVGLTIPYVKENFYKEKMSAYIDDIVKSYINLSNQYLGIEEGVIYTPYELTDQQIQDIEKAISQKENKKVTLKVSIDPSLLGGIKVQIANRIYDGTIKNKVEMLKKELLRK